MRQRYYDPGIGRFLNVDPMASDTTTGWNFNRYNYAANNPYKFTDPDGRSRQSIGSPQQMLRVLNEQAARGTERAIDMTLSAAGRVASGAVSLGEMAVGAVEVGAGALMQAGGLEEAGGAVMVIGMLTMADGAIGLANAADGGNRDSIPGAIGRLVGGETGAKVGNLLSAGRSGVNAAKGVDALLGGAGKKEAAATAVEAASTVKTTAEVSNPPRGDKINR